jgi:hypothetical protein
MADGVFCLALSVRCVANTKVCLSAAFLCGVGVRSVQFWCTQTSQMHLKRLCSAPNAPLFGLLGGGKGIKAVLGSIAEYGDRSTCMPCHMTV